MKKVINEDSINKLIRYIFISIFTFIFLLLLLLNNYICLILIISLLLLLFLIKKYSNCKIFNKLDNIINKKYKIIIKIIFILLFVIQIILINNIFFETGWDIYHVLSAATNFINNGSFSNIDYFNVYPYFEIYPNNVTIVFLFILLIKISKFIGFSNHYKFLVLIGTILIDLAGLIMIKTISNFTNNKKYILFSALLFFCFIGLSPWFLVPYSDSYSIIFPISILYNYTKKDKKIYNYILIGILSYFGYLIKPTCIIILIAIIILELFKYLFSKRKNKIVFKNYLATAIGIFSIFIFKYHIQYNVIEFVSTKTYQFSLYHYIMMGLNTETCGTFSHHDVLSSLKQKNYEKRITYNKKIIKERIKSLSLKEKLAHLINKTKVNYNDGTFAWGKEGEFYKKVNKKNTLLANFLKSIYYNDGNNFQIFYVIMQTIWLFILLISLLGASIKKANSKDNLIYLSIIGITLFTLIFEARARYLYIYSTYYIIATTIGIEAIYNKYIKNK